jgi:hypothetical protein
MILAPIAFFAYNRPWHTEQTLSALIANDLASDSVIYFFIDGPKLNADQEQIKKQKQVIDIIYNYKSHFKEFYVEISPKNKGLANSVISGVSNVINKLGKVIVLEDDLVSSPYFLKYMNDCLNYYENDSNIFSISAYNHSPQKMPIPIGYKYDMFLSYRNGSWGWGTWKNRWNKVDWDMQYFTNLTHNDIKKFNRGGQDVYPMLKLQYEGKIDSWAIRFSFSHFQNNTFSIYPIYSYINNLGCDGSGVHCGKTKITLNDITKAKKTINLVKSSMLYDKKIIDNYYKVYKPLNILKRGLNKIHRLIFDRNIFY